MRGPPAIGQWNILKKSNVKGREKYSLVKGGEKY